MVTLHEHLRALLYDELAALKYRMPGELEAAIEWIETFLTPSPL